jgi:heptosyltransferase-2
MGAGILIFGSHGEEDRCSQIEGLITAASPGTVTVNLAGKLPFPETAAMMDRCAVVVTNDSGLMHIAASRKRNIVAIFGSTTEELGFFPYGTHHIVVEDSGLPCRPCTHIGRAACPKGHFKCMNDIPTSRVIEAARELLDA